MPARTRAMSLFLQTGCKAHAFTACRACFKAARGEAPEVTCPSGCALRTYNAPNDTLRCDACKAKLAKGSGFHGCKAHAHTRCRDCFKKATTGGAAAAASAAAVAALAAGQGKGALTVPTCPSGCALRSYVAPTAGLACTSCAAPMAKGDPFHGCKAHKATVCRACFRRPTASAGAQADVTCPGAHGLRPYACPAAGVRCDLCAAQLSAGDPFRGCKVCKFTACAACVARGQRAGGAAATPGPGLLSSLGGLLAAATGGDRHAEERESFDFDSFGGRARTLREQREAAEAGKLQ